MRNIDSPENLIVCTVLSGWQNESHGRGEGRETLSKKLEFPIYWCHSIRLLENNLLIYFLLCIFTKEEPQKCEKPRICLQTLDRLREFSSDSDQQCNRVREDGFREKKSMYLEKCPSIIGRSSELKNPLQSGDTSPKVAQKVCRALVQCFADDFFFFFLV